MKKESVFEWLKRTACVLGFAVLVALVFALDWYYRSAEETEAGVNQPDSLRHVPPEKRHENLDNKIVSGLKSPGNKGIEQIEVGSLVIRKKKMGFIRIGGLNEVLLEDLRVTVNEDFFLPSCEPSARGREQAPSAVQSPGKHSSLVNRGHSHLVGGTSRTGIQLRQLVRDLAPQVRSLSLLRPKKVSSVTVCNVSVVLARENVPDLCIVECRSLAPDPEERELKLHLKGRVTFRNTADETLHCGKAVVCLDERCLVIAGDVTVLTSDGTNKLEKLRFPLDSLVKNPGFLTFRLRH